VTSYTQLVPTNELIAPRHYICRLAATVKAAVRTAAFHSPHILQIRHLQSTFIKDYEHDFAKETNRA